MSAKQTAKAEKQEKAPPTQRKDVQVRVKTRATGTRGASNGVIFSNEWKYLTLDDKGSAYKAISTNPNLVMEHSPPPVKEVATADAQPSKGKEAK